MMLALLFAGSFFTALISGSAGFGGALLLLPIATVCLVDLVVPTLSVAQLLSNIARMTTGWKIIDWKSVLLFSITALPLAALGAFGYALLPKDIVTRCIGAILIFLVIVKMYFKRDLPKCKATLLIGGALAGGLSGLCGSGGPISVVIFLSLNLSPVAYIASEATAATAMHMLKIAIYSKFTNLDAYSTFIGLLMGIYMAIGIYAAKHYIKNMKKSQFQKYVAILLGIIGLYMLIAEA